VRRVQDARKNAGFEIEDRVLLAYQAGAALAAVFETLGDYIAAETLASDLVAGPAPDGSHVETFELADESVTIGVKRVE
ncbi:MAG: hypothetical protein JXA89_17900, partial [Anaerolineae bacterium]|nr:hypothetical protein [Anaerolineae bacterium]